MTGIAGCRGALARQRVLTAYTLGSPAHAERGREGKWVTE
jgi:hypothetical protein